MPLFSRRPTLPAQIRTSLDLRHGDNVLAVAALNDGAWVVASRQALHVAPPSRSEVPSTAPGTGPVPTVARHAWSEVDRATLDPESSELTVHWITGGSECLRLADPTRSIRFAQVLRERVQASVVHSEVVSLSAGRVIKVALRRDEEGQLLSQVIGDGRTDLSDPAVAALVDAAERRVRGAAGLPQ